MRTHLLVFMALISLSLAGCASKRIDERLPQDGKTVEEIFDTYGGGDVHQVRKLNEAVERGVKNGTLDLDGYSRTQSKELNALFTELPNPRLVMYIYPHLTESNRGVPGYATSFPMYEKVHYALPGEVEGR